MSGCIDRMTTAQKYHFELQDHRERLSFFLGLLKDDSISNYFKEKLVEPWLESVLDIDAPNLNRLYSEAVEDARKAA